MRSEKGSNMGGRVEKLFLQRILARNRWMRDRKCQNLRTRCVHLVEEENEPWVEKLLTQ